MKRYLFIAAVFLTTVLFTFAEPPAAPGGEGRPKLSPSERAQHRLEHMTKELSLTTDQQAKLKPILEAEAADVSKVMQDKSLPKEERRKSLGDIMKDYAPQVEAVLTPEQQTKWKAMRAKHMKEFKGKRGEKKGGDDAPAAQ